MTKQDDDDIIGTDETFHDNNNTGVESNWSLEEDKRLLVVSKKVIMIMLALMNGFKVIITLMPR